MVLGTNRRGQVLCSVFVRGTAQYLLSTRGLVRRCQGCSLLYLMGHQRNNARGGRG